MNATTENFIGIYEDAFSRDFCDNIVSYFEALSAAGLTQKRQHGKTDVTKTMIDDEQLFAHDITSISGSISVISHFNEIFWGEIYPHYVGTFDILKRFDKHNNYHFKVQKTEIGGGYHLWHAESGSKQQASRILAWTLYLNDVDEGGETEFLYYPKRIKPKAGTLILWPAGITHTHRGNPPISNTKYIVTGWIEF